MSTRILIVEDNEVMRSALEQFLEDWPEFEVVGAVERAEEALEYLSGAGTADLVLADTRLPGGMSGIDLVRRLRDTWPELPCLMYSGHEEREYVEAALAAGARGYLLKGTPDKLPVAIQQVCEGEEYIDEEVEQPW